MKIESIKNQNNSVNFQRIVKLKHCGEFFPGSGYRRYYSDSEALVDRAFKENKIIQEYCKEKDVDVEIGTFKKTTKYRNSIWVYGYVSSLKIYDTFKNIEGNIFEKIKHFFNYKNKGICISSSDSGRAHNESWDSEKELAKKINEIKTQEDLLKYFDA